MSAARELGMPRVVADALEQQAHLAVADDEDRAIELHQAALAERVEHGLRTFYVDSLEALATLGARAGRASAAVRVLAASGRARVSMAYPHGPACRRAHEATVASLRAPWPSEQDK